MPYMLNYDRGSNVIVYVAYNAFGDLIAEAYSWGSLVARIEAAGYALSEVTTGRVTP